jgi:poly-beta-1,6 N-acetyl-D-glucosamine export porin PgaA
MCKSNNVLLTKPALLAVALSLAFSASHAGQLTGSTITVKSVYQHADAGDWKGALAEVSQLIKEQPSNLEALEARAYLLRGQKQYTQALADYQKMLALDSKSATGLKGVVICLRALGASQLAQQYASRRPELFSEEERRTFALEQGSAFVRMGDTDAEAGTGAFALTDSARSHFERLARDWNIDTSLGLPQNAKFDYIVALYKRKQFAQVRESYEQLVAKGVTIPDYVLPLVSQSYAAMPDASTALAIIEPVYQRHPEQLGAVWGYFYALVDTEQHQRAQEVLNKAIAATPVFLDAKSPTMRRPNPDYVALLTLSAMGLAFDDRLNAAESRFKAILKEAPANPSARSGLGTVYLWQGYARKAEAELLSALASAPDYKQLRLDLATTKASRGDEKAARALYREMAAESENDAPLARAMREQRERERGTLEVTTGRSTAGILSPTVAGETFSKISVSSRLVDDTWRLIGQVSGHSADVYGRSVDQRYARVGAEVQGQDVAGSIALAHTLRGKTGLALSGRWSPSDEWVLRGNVDTVLAEVPARGAEAGLSGKQASLSAEWSPQYGRTFSAAATVTRFSDDNTQRAASLKWREIWSQQASMKLWTALSGWTSTSSNQNVAYFSPSHVASVTGTVGVDLLQSRKGWLNKSLWHHIEVDSGWVKQASHGAAATGALRYRLDWRINKFWRAEVSVERARAVYDGTPEFHNSMAVTIGRAL